MSNGTYKFTKWDEKPSSKVDGGPSTATASITFVYNGVVTGEGTADLVMFYRADGSGTFAGYEQIIGTVDGKPGTFVWRHEGTYDGNGITDTFEVLAGSGTGALSDLRGRGNATAVAGENDVTLSFQPEL